MQKQFLGNRRAADGGVPTDRRRVRRMQRENAQLVAWLGAAAATAASRRPHWPFNDDDEPMLDGNNYAY